jgi:hypothetical protein
MKTTVSIQEISEFEIKPKAAVAEWRRLVAAEIKRCWPTPAELAAVAWPTCRADETVPAFAHDGFEYMESRTCGSLFAARRPIESELWSWYREGAPAVFWREHILPASAVARLEKIMRPRADWVMAGIAEYWPAARRVLDLSPHGRPLLDIMAAQNPQLQFLAAGMTADLEGTAGAAIRVEPTKTADLPRQGQTDIVIASDTFNRTADLGLLIAALEQTMIPGGLVFATLAVASGFEIQALWDRSPTIIAPDKLNLPTIVAIQRMFQSPRWEIIELSTPGMFDVEMVRQTIMAEPGLAWPRVIRSLVEATDAAGRLAIVELLQARRLTSSARLILRKLT